MSSEIKFLSSSFPVKAIADSAFNTKTVRQSFDRELDGEESKLELDNKEIFPRKKLPNCNGRNGEGENYKLLDKSELISIEENISINGTIMAVNNDMFTQSTSPKNTSLSGLTPEGEKKGGKPAFSDPGLVDSKFLSSELLIQDCIEGNIKGSMDLNGASASLETSETQNVRSTSLESSALGIVRDANGTDQVVKIQTLLSSAELSQAGTGFGTKSGGSLDNENLNTSRSSQVNETQRPGTPLPDGGSNSPAMTEASAENATDARPKSETKTVAALSSEMTPSSASMDAKVGAGRDSENLNTSRALQGNEAQRPVTPLSGGVGSLSGVNTANSAPSNRNQSKNADKYDRKGSRAVHLSGNSGAAPLVTSHPNPVIAAASQDLRGQVQAGGGSDLDIDPLDFSGKDAAKSGSKEEAAASGAASITSHKSDQGAAGKTESIQSAFTRINQGVELLKQDRLKSVQLKLNLEQGHTVRIHLNLRGQSLRTVIFTDSEQLKSAFRESWESFSRELSEKGVDANELQFSLSQDGRRSSAQDIWDEKSLREKVVDHTALSHSVKRFNKSAKLSNPEPVLKVDRENHKLIRFA